jgi:hypothetical protein
MHLSTAVPRTKRLRGHSRRFDGASYPRDADAHRRNGEAQRAGGARWPHRGTFTGVGVGCQSRSATTPVARSARPAITAAARYSGYGLLPRPSPPVGRRATTERGPLRQAPRRADTLR